MIYGSNGATSSFRCSKDACSCDPDSTCYMKLTVYEKNASDQPRNEKDGCKLGDRVKVYREDTFTLIVYELEVFSDEGE